MWFEGNKELVITNRQVDKALQEKEQNSLNQNYLFLDFGEKMGSETL